MNAQTKLDLASELVHYSELIATDHQKNVFSSAHVQHQRDALKNRMSLIGKWSSTSTPEVDDQWAELTYRINKCAVHLLCAQFEANTWNLADD